MLETSKLVIDKLKTVNGGVAWFPLDEKGTVTPIRNQFNPTGPIVGNVGTGIIRDTDESNPRYKDFYTFIGTASSYIQANQKVMPTGSFTIRFSIKMSTKPTGSNQEIISNAYARTSDSGIRIWVDVNGLITFTNCYKNSSYYGWTITDSSYSFDNSWVDYMMTFNNSNRVVILYKNGVEISRTTARHSNTIAPTFNLMIGRQPDTSYTRYFKGSLAHIEIYNKVLTPKDFLFNATLLLNKDTLEYSYYNGTEWVNLGVDVVEADFIRNGMMNVEPLFERVNGVSPLDLPENNEGYKLVTWANKNDINTEVFLPTDGQYLIPKQGILLLNIDKVISLNINATETTKFAFSLNEGLNWLKYDNGSFIEITDIKNGNTTTEITNIPVEDLTQLINEETSLKIGSYLENQEVLNSIRLVVDMKGMAIFAPNTSYTLEYNLATKTIKVNISQNGDYYVNYLDVM